MGKQREWPTPVLAISYDLLTLLQGRRRCCSPGAGGGAPKTYTHTLQSFCCWLSLCYLSQIGLSYREWCWLAGLVGRRL